MSEDTCKCNERLNTCGSNSYLKEYLQQQKSKMMTVKGKCVCQPANNFHIETRDKLTITTSKCDFIAVLQTGNIPTKVCNECKGRPVINIGHTRTFNEEKSLNTGHDSDNLKDNILLSPKKPSIPLHRAKSSEKGRQHRKNSKCFRHRKRIGTAKRKPNLFIHSLSMACMVLSIFKAETVECLDIVSWEVETKPILFGETLELLCKISDKENLCTGSFQQWYGSKKDILLCQNGKCINEDKYTIRKNANCSYSLLIHNLSTSDVDIAYSCAFGINEMKKGLMMKDYEFFKLPRNNSVSPSLTINNSIVDVSLKINDIYPEPNCTILLHEKDITENANISSTVTQDGIFFTYIMHIMHTVTKKDCGSPLMVYCYIESFAVTNFTKELDNCTDFTSDPWMGNISTLIISMIILTTVVVICVIICVLIYLYRKKYIDNENSTKPETRETTPWMSVEYKKSETVEVGWTIPLNATISNKAQTDDTRDSCSEMTDIADTT